VQAEIIRFWSIPKTLTADMFWYDHVRKHQNFNSVCLTFLLYSVGSGARQGSLHIHSLVQSSTFACFLFKLGQLHLKSVECCQFTSVRSCAHFFQAACNWTTWKHNSRWYPYL